MSEDLKRRIRLFVQRFWQPASACMTFMPGSWYAVMSGAHWMNALRTGLITGLLAVLLTYTPAARLYSNRYGNALIVGLLTILGDLLSHRSHQRLPIPEPIVTGIVSGLLSLGASYLFEDRARRLRTFWASISRRKYG